MKHFSSGHIRPSRNFLFILLLVLIASHFSIQSVLAQEDFGEIILGVPANFPPQYYVDEETGEHYAFAIDVMDEIALRSWIEVRYVVYDTWPQVSQALSDGVIDGIPNMGIT